MGGLTGSSQIGTAEGLSARQVTALYKPSTTSDAPIHSSYTMNLYRWSCRRKIVLKEQFMSNKNLRIGIRIIHLIAAATLGVYFYSPIAGDETLRL
jgi:hypothetical protein